MKKEDFSGKKKKAGAELKQKNKIFWAKCPPKWKNRSRTPKLPPFHCVSEANAWASAHALSMVTWHHHNFVNDYHLIMFTHLFKAESAINDFILRSESSQNYLFFPKGIHKLIPKGIKEQAGAQRSQAQLKLGLGFTPTNLHHIDEKESFKHLLFTAPNSHNQPYFVYSKLLLYYPGFEGDGGDGRLQ